MEGLGYDNPAGKCRMITPGCHREDTYSWVYCHKTDAITKHVINMQILIFDFCNRYRYGSNVTNLSNY